MPSSHELQELLKDNESANSKCYTCAHPVAGPLVPLLIQELGVQQKQGKMRGYSRRALFRSVVQHCKKKGLPFERTPDAFRNHLRNHTDWLDAQSA